MKYSKSLSKKRVLSKSKKKSSKRSSSKKQEELLALRLNEIIEKNKRAEKAKKYKVEINIALMEVKAAEQKIIDKEEDDYKIKMIKEIVEIVYNGRDDERYNLYYLAGALCDNRIINPKKRAALNVMATRMGISQHDIKTLDNISLCEKIRYGDYSPGLLEIFNYGFLFPLFNGLFNYSVTAKIKYIKDSIIQIFLTQSYIYNSVFLNDINATVRQKAYWLKNSRFSESRISSLITYINILIQNQGTTFLKDLQHFRIPRTGPTYDKITPKHQSDLQKLYEILNYILTQVIKHRDILNSDKEVLAECERIKEEERRRKEEMMRERRHREHMRILRNVHKRRHRRRSSSS